MIALLPARVVFQVYSSRFRTLPEADITGILGRHPIPLGHVEVESVHRDEWTARLEKKDSRLVLPRPRDFMPTLAFEDYARIRRALRVYRIEAVEVEPEDLGYLRAAMLIAGEIAALTDGLIVDVAAWKTMTAVQVADQIDRAFHPMHHISLHVDVDSWSHYWIHTHGMTKFRHPDFEIHGVPVEAVDVALQLLNNLASVVVSGGRFLAGEHTQLCGFEFSFGHCAQERAGHFPEGALRLAQFELLEETTCPGRQALAACA